MKHVLALAFVLTACGQDDRAVRATDYDGTCNVPGDCTIINVGACTDACGYPSDWTAINAKDAARAQQDYKALDCGPGASNCNPGESPTGVSCTNNHCGLQY